MFDCDERSSSFFDSIDEAKIQEQMNGVHENDSKIGNHLKLKNPFEDQFASN